MHGHELALPTSAQPLVAECSTRPDFLYADHQTAIYVDGPPHDDPRRAERDAGQTTCMEDHGYMVIRFGHHDDWAAIVRRYPSVFGKLA
jgi:very-short-patch-repair endonuclease